MVSLPIRSFGIFLAAFKSRSVEEGRFALQEVGLLAYYPGYESAYLFSSTPVVGARSLLWLQGHSRRDSTTEATSSPQPSMMAAQAPSAPALDPKILEEYRSGAVKNTIVKNRQSLVKCYNAYTATKPKAA